jgi:hypothetical protein
VPQEILLDEFAAGLKEPRVSSAQAVCDATAQPPRPAKEFGVMSMLDIVHRKHRGLGAIKGLQHDGRRVDDIGVLVHHFTNLPENIVACGFVHFLAERKQRRPAEVLPQSVCQIVECDYLKIPMVPQRFEQVLILASGIHSELVAIRRLSEPPQQASRECIETSDKRRIETETINRDPHRSAGSVQ